MFDFIFNKDISFQAFTSHHLIPVISGSVLMVIFILVAKRFFSSRQQQIYGTILATLPLICVLARMCFTHIEDRFSLQEELPIHLCRILAFVVPFMVYYRNKKWFGILYFLIIVGTLQAILTPDLNFGPPHWSYYLYWILHVVLFWVPIYVIVIYGFRPEWVDFKRSFILGNIYMVCTLIINHLLNSNYFYTRHKPESASLLDVMGPWPIYIFVVELLAFVLFLLAMVPFLKRKSINMKL